MYVYALHKEKGKTRKDKQDILLYIVAKQNEVKLRSWWAGYWQLSGQFLLVLCFPGDC